MRPCRGLTTKGQNDPSFAKFASIFKEAFMVFKQHKGQTFFLALIGLVASVGLLAIVIFDLRKLPHEEHFLLDTPILYWIFKGFCLLCFCFCAVGDIYLFRQLSSKEPLAEICDQYFYDNSSSISLGRIAWSDMQRVYAKGAFLNIKLKDPEKYLENKNWLQRLLIRSNLKLGYGDVCISPQRFKKDAEVFIEEFTKRRQLDP